MQGDQIEYALHSRTGGQFRGVYACDRLPLNLPHRRPLIIIANTDPSDRQGEHWVLIRLGPNRTGEFFDSLGQPPKPIFRRYMDRFCTRWISNVDQQLQSIISYYCGHYVIFYALFSSIGYSMHEILSSFTSDNSLNDHIVHSFVCRNIL